MRQHSNLAKDTAEKVVKDIRRATRKQLIGLAHSSGSLSDPREAISVFLRRVPSCVMRRGGEDIGV